MNLHVKRLFSYIAILLAALPVAMAQRTPDFVDYLLQDERYHEVVRLASAQLDKRHPRNAVLYYQRAQAYLQLGDCEQALSDLNRAVQYAKSYNLPMHHVYYLRGTLNEYLGAGKRALDDYSKLIKLFPDSLLGYQSRAQFYARQGDYTSAYKDYTTLRSLAPNNPAYALAQARCQLVMGREAESLGQIRTLLAHPMSSDLQTDAYRLLMVSTPDTAEYITSALTYNILYYGTHHAVDNLYELEQLMPTRHASTLIDALTARVDTIRPAELRAYYLSLLSRCYTLSGNDEEALRQLASLADMAPQWQVWVDEQRADLYVSASRPEEAIACLTRLIASVPHQPVYYLQRAACYVDSEDLLSAVSDYEHVSSSHNDYTGYANYELGRIYMQQGDYRSAEYAFTDALRDWSQPEAYLERARANLALSRTDAAERDLQYVLSHDSTSLYAYALALGGHHDEAVAYMEHLLSVAPASDTASLHYDAACICALAGRSTDALAQLESALSAGFAYPAQLQRDPDLATIRGESGYALLLRKYHIGSAQ